MTDDLDAVITAIIDTTEQPKLLVHCTALYAEFDKTAIDKPEGRVWSGYILDIIDRVGIPRGSYPRVIGTLKQIKCIEQVARGYRDSPTEILLLRPPVAEEIAEISPARDLTRPPDPAILAQSVEDIQKNLGGINIVEAFRNIETRLQAIEAVLRNTGTAQDS